MNFVWFRWTFNVEWSFMFVDCVTIASFHLVLFGRNLHSVRLLIGATKNNSDGIFFSVFLLSTISGELYSLNIPLQHFVCGVVFVCLFFSSFLADALRKPMSWLGNCVSTFLLMRVERLKMWIVQVEFGFSK